MSFFERMDRIWDATYAASFVALLQHEDDLVDRLPVHKVDELAARAVDEADAAVDAIKRHHRGKFNG